MNKINLLMFAAMIGTVIVFNNTANATSNKIQDIVEVVHVKQAEQRANILDIISNRKNKMSTAKFNTMIENIKAKQEKQRAAIYNKVAK